MALSAQPSYTDTLLQERRKSPRVSYSDPVIIRRGKWITLGAGLNLSESGMALVTSTESRTKPGQRIRIMFTLPRSSGWISIDAVVVRRGSLEGHPVLGIHFSRMVPRVRQMIRAFVSA
jgi:c-di-GMP-binding flagellar brake protein YcgR